MAGVVLTFLTIACLEYAARESLTNKNPGGNLLMVVMFVTYLSGFRIGVICSCISIIYLVLINSNPGTYFVFSPKAANLLIWSTIFFAFFVYLVGSLQDRLRNAAIREFDAREAAEREAKGRLQTEEDRERLAAIVESSEDAIVSKSLQGIIESWNRGAEKMFGYSREEVLGKPFSILIPPERLSEETNILDQISRGESTGHFETVRIRKDGSPIDVSVSISPVRDRDGVVIGASKVVRDISKRKQAEGRLQDQLSRMNLLQHITHAIGERQDLKSIFQVVICTLEEHLPVDFCCICLYDQVDNVLTVSGVGLKSTDIAMKLAMTEFARVEIDENGLSRCVRGELVYEPDIEEVPFPFPTRLAQGGLRSLVAAPLLVESQVFGVLVAARCEANSFSSQDCEFLRYLSEHVALASHQAELYGALQHAYDDLRQTQQAIMQQERLRALGQMASGIAHDINNAISPVALYTETLLENEPNLSPRARSYLEITARAIDDVAATVARMREFYREKEPQSKLTPVDMNRLVQEVVDLTRARWRDIPLQQGIVIKMYPELKTDLPTVMGIESEVREVLTNLILNAVDAMPEGGTLTVRTLSAENLLLAVPGQVLVEVVDTGVGMDENTRRRCLEPFFTTKGERGTGLGLAMVYGVMQRHGADIEVESAVGQGTTVRLAFAISSGAVGLPETFATAPISATRILVVDDDPLLLKSLRDTLESEGHVVETASGGQAGIDAFRAANSDGKRFPVVITDLGMPSVDGRKVANSIKDEAPSTYVIMLTGWGHRLTAEGDIPPHVDCVLNKPPKLRDLREALTHSMPKAA